VVSSGHSFEEKNLSQSASGILNAVGLSWEIETPLTPQLPSMISRLGKTAASSLSIGLSSRNRAGHQSIIHQNWFST
jgi:hypothetical protein